MSSLVTTYRLDTDYSGGYDLWVTGTVSPSAHARKSKPIAPLIVALIGFFAVDASTDQVLPTGYKVFGPFVPVMEIEKCGM